MSPLVGDRMLKTVNSHCAHKRQIGILVFRFLWSTESSYRVTKKRKSRDGCCRKELKQEVVLHEVKNKRSSPVSPSKSFGLFENSSCIREEYFAGEFRIPHVLCDVQFTNHIKWLVKSSGLKKKKSLKVIWKLCSGWVSQQHGLDASTHPCWSCLHVDFKGTRPYSWVKG